MKNTRPKQSRNAAALRNLLDTIATMSEDDVDTQLADMRENPDTRHPITDRIIRRALLRRLDVINNERNDR